MDFASAIEKVELELKAVVTDDVSGLESASSCACAWRYGCDNLDGVIDGAIGKRESAEDDKGELRACFKEEDKVGVAMGVRES